MEVTGEVDQLLVLTPHQQHCCVNLCPAVGWRVNNGFHLDLTLVFALQ